MKWFIKENKWKKIYSSFEKGWGNGYVLIPPGHKYYGVDYNDIPVKVHGGLTYGEKVTKSMIKFWGLNKKTKGMWCVGFDTAHFMDNPIDCNYEYVTKETLLLKKQLNNYGIFSIRKVCKKCKNDKKRMDN